MATQKKNTQQLQNSLLRVTRVHFFFALVIAAQIIIYDAWKVLTPESVMQRWGVVAGLVIVNTFVWYLAHYKSLGTVWYKLLTFLIIVSDIFVASSTVYGQRGMASRAVLLFVVPIVVSGILLSRTAIFATAILCITAYVTTTVTYFVLHFNEGYKTELYGEVGFYSVIFILLAALLTVIVQQRKQT